MDKIANDSSDAMNCMEFPDVKLRLHALRVIRMQVCDRYPPISVELAAYGQPEMLEVIQDFANASWLSDLDFPYLDSLLNLADEKYGISLREEGWAVLEGDGNWVRVSDSYGDARCTLVAWEEFKAVMQLKRKFLCLMRLYKGQGVPRYSDSEGFRVRLHVPCE